MVTTFIHKVGEADDATGPIRTRVTTKASNLTTLRGAIVALGTGTAVIANATTPGPFGVVKHSVLDTEGKTKVEIYWNTKATIYVKTGAACKRLAYAKINGTNKPIPWVNGTDLDFTLLFGQYVQDGATQYDGETDLVDSIDNGIGGFIMGMQ